jgi:hypothetical protein
MECVIETKPSMILQFIDGLRRDVQDPPSKAVFSMQGGFELSAASTH